MSKNLLPLLVWRNTQNLFSTFDKKFHVYLMRGLQKLNSVDGFLRADQKSAARWAGLAELFWRYLKKPLWDFNFLHIFAIPLSSRPEKHWQMLERLFGGFRHSRKIYIQHVPFTKYLTYKFVIWSLSIFQNSIGKDVCSEHSLYWLCCSSQNLFQVLAAF